jgi:hypothetical protein
MNDTDENTSQTLTVHMEGIDSVGGDLRLNVFIDKLDAFRAALQETDRLIRDERKSMDFLVSNLSHNSPAAVTVAGYGAADQQVNDVFDYLSNLVSSLTSQTATHYSSPTLLEKILDLCNGYGDRFSRMWFSRSGKTVAVIDTRTRNSILAILGRVSYASGSVKGKVERYNSHGEKKYFYLYPLIGERVKCFFDEDHRQDAASAVEKDVTVYGRLCYRDGEFFPYQMYVETIEVNSSLQASLADLIGSAPNATGEQSSTDFIRDLRDGWN